MGSALAERLERDGAAPTVGAPLVAIVEILSPTSAALACGHRVLLPNLKKPPRSLPCFRCLDGDPPDREVVLSALAAAREDDLAVYLGAIDRRAAMLTPDPEAEEELRRDRAGTRR